MISEITEETGPDAGDRNQNEEGRAIFVQQPLSKSQVDYAYELIDEIHPIEKYPIWVAYPYLKWITSKCCYGLPYFKPYDPSVDNGNMPSAVAQEENEQLMNNGQSAVHGGSNTIIINGKEYKKRSKKPKKSNMGEQA